MTYSNVTPKEAFQKMQEGYLYLDVRTVEEFKNGHAKGAVNIPIFISGPAGRQPNPNFVDQVKEKLPPPAKLVIGCHSGGRSGRACEILDKEGYQHLFNIDGGFGGRMDGATGQLAQVGWKAEGLPCE